MGLSVTIDSGSLLPITFQNMVAAHVIRISRKGIIRAILVPIAELIESYVLYVSRNNKNRFFQSNRRNKN